MNGFDEEDDLEEHVERVGIECLTHPYDNNCDHIIECEYIAIIWDDMMKIDANRILN